MEAETLEQRVVQYLREYNLISTKSRIVVAVSGGTDSICLLKVLVNKQAELDIKLHIAHLNHQLRGGESDSDAEFVNNLATELEVPATIEKRDVATYRSEKRCSLEEAAREVRYNFLAEVAHTENADCIAVGHTRDDQVETILMHILRGSGTRGLCGLQAQTSMKVINGKYINIIRPILVVSHQETLDYCREWKLKPRMDSSNISHAFFRNRIRYELLPLLKNYNPEIDSSLLRLSAIVADELSYIEDQVHELWDKVVTEGGGVISLDRKMMIDFAPAIQKLIFRHAITRLIGNLKDITAEHIEAMVALLAKPAGKSLNLPKGLIIYAQYDSLLLARKGGSVLSPFSQLERLVCLNIPGKTVIPGWKIETKIIQSPANVDKADFAASFDLDKTGTELLVRHREPGDRFQPLGMTQFKKLQDFMVDTKIPRTWRDMIPLLCSPEQILWVVGWRIDERAKVTEATEKILHVEFTRLSQ
jgi:tRNA(Ile)-lysidine synthase